MEESSQGRVSRKDGTREASKDGPTTKSRYSVDKGGDVIGCSGKFCESCAAGMIADCVALCCCPCAFVNLLTLVFFKVPWMIGRRCLGRRESKKKKMETKRKCKKGRESSHEGGIVVEKDGELKIESVEKGSVEIATVSGEGEEMDSVSAGHEAERVWSELHQVGHLGFGRVSF